MSKVLKQVYQCPLETVDQIIRSEPFLVPARIVRGSILGLLGEESWGLKEIPTAHYGAAFGEWVGYYHRGLLLLKLERHNEAREQLIGKASALLTTTEDSVLLRLAAAMTYICEGKLDGARRVLQAEGNVLDAYAQYLKHVLELHVAIESGNDAEEKVLLDQLRPVATMGHAFSPVIDALRNRDMARAKRLELNLLCMAA
jgi:hypothetical protein